MYINLAEARVEVAWCVRQEAKAHTANENE